MVTEGLDLGKEELEIIKLIRQKKNFLLSGGAGSGKTYSLVQIIRYILNQDMSARIACVTFTRSARDEIKSRVDGEHLRISTIHDFLWDCIKPYQTALKEILIKLINEKKTDAKGNEQRTIKHLATDEDDLSLTFFDGKIINYKDVRRLTDGIISHDEIIILTNCLFKTHPKLGRIIQDRFQYIFIDEYQDTFEEVIEIFLSILPTNRTVIGCFGDEMQSIYDKRIGSLKNYIDEKKIYRVDKEENRRNPLSVINLANKLRTDGLQQQPSEDPNAPNMNNGKIKLGDIKFFYTNNDTTSIYDLKKELTDNYQWDFSEKNIAEIKELNLTHNLIAEKAGFKALLELYHGDGIIEFRNRIKDHIKTEEINKDFSTMTFGEVIDFLQQGKVDKELKKVMPTATMKNFIDSNQNLYQFARDLLYVEFLKTYIDVEMLTDEEKHDPIIKQLMKIQVLIDLYQNNQVNEFIRQTEYVIKSIEDKKIIQKHIEELIQKSTTTIHDVIELADQSKLLLKDDSFNSYCKQRSYLYEQISKLPFSTFQKFYIYHTDKTPFSTQHKVKGLEFDDVLVIMDNGKWNNYNFEYLFTNDGKDSVIERTQKIFYVCCTRAKNRLAVFYMQPKKEVVDKATEWFGTENIIEL